MRKSGNGFLYFAVGALCVVVAVFALDRFGAFQSDEPDITIELPDLKSN